MPSFAAVNFVEKNFSAIHRMYVDFSERSEYLSSCKPVGFNRFALSVAGIAGIQMTDDKNADLPLDPLDLEADSLLIDDDDDLDNDAFISNEI